jgi:hypothetical protein
MKDPPTSVRWIEEINSDVVICYHHHSPARYPIYWSAQYYYIINLSRRAV